MYNQGWWNKEIKLTEELYDGKQHLFFLLHV